jgi:hypothetical protein
MLAITGPSYAATYDITQVTNNSFADWPAQINNNGTIVYVGMKDIKNFASAEIFIYDGNTTTQLTDNDYADMLPQINDNGEIVWVG